MAKTKYYIKAYLDVKGVKDFKYKSVFMVREHPEEYKQNIGKLDRDEIKTWGCCS